MAQENENLPQPSEQPSVPPDNRGEPDQPSVPEPPSESQPQSEPAQEQPESQPEPQESPEELLASRVAEQQRQYLRLQERSRLLQKARGETEEAANAALPILCALLEKHQRIPESPQERQNLVDHAFDLAQVVSAKARALLVSNLAAGGLDADGQWLENQPD